MPTTQEEKVAEVIRALSELTIGMRVRLKKPSVMPVWMNYRQPGTIEDRLETGSFIVRWDEEPARAVYSYMPSSLDLA